MYARCQYMCGGGGGSACRLSQCIIMLVIFNYHNNKLVKQKLLVPVITRVLKDRMAATMPKVTLV